MVAMVTTDYGSLYMTDLTPCIIVTFGQAFLEKEREEDFCCCHSNHVTWMTCLHCIEPCHIRVVTYYFRIISHVISALIPAKNYLYDFVFEEL